MQGIESVDTHLAKTVEEVAHALKIANADVVKSLLVQIDEEWVLLLLRGDHELNEIKLKHELNASSFRLAEEAEVEDVLGVPPGNIGPVGVKKMSKLLPIMRLKECATLFVERMKN